MNPASNTSTRRLGDAVAIPGDYQHRALQTGPRVQRYWHRTKLRMLDWLFPIQRDSTVLDVGCGSGVFVDAIASHGATVTGVDANVEAIAYAEATFGGPGRTFRRGYLDELDLPEASFDAATCIEIVEHVHLPQSRRLLADLQRVIRPGGRLLISTPNYHGLWPVIEWLVDHTHGRIRMSGTQHITHFSRASLRRLVVDAGFEIVDERTICTFAPFIAGVSFRIADHVERLERGLNLPFGNLAVIVARTPARG